MIVAQMLEVADDEVHEDEPLFDYDEGDKAFVAELRELAEQAAALTTR
jgi:hypothetical protein